MHQDVLRESCKVLSQLNTAVFLLSGDGKCIFPRQPDSFLLPHALSVEACQAHKGYLFLLLPGLSGEVLAIKDSPGAADFLHLTSAMMHAIGKMYGADGGLNSALRRLLKGGLTPPELAALVHQHAFAEALPRCVMLITLEKTDSADAADVLRGLLPIEETDALVSMDQHTAALIRDMKGLSAGEMIEFAAALQDTLMNELGQQAVIGLGETVPLLSSLPLSYEQAAAAVLLSRVFAQESGVYDYRSLLLERFVMQTPQAVAQHFYPLIFNRKTAKLLSDDMLKTITMFLEKNLNLSDASRELYIHRNTLVYRLDKVQKHLGLDLRKFHDAMTFKLLLDLKKRADTLPGTGLEAPGKGTP